MKKNIVIIHYNTPRLTECLVRSINLFVKDAIIYIFDNSDKDPFTAEFDNVMVIDNTKGELINFDEWLENYPERINTSAGRNGYGSAKHAYSVQKCIELIDENFILLDSDILLKKDISDLINDEYAFVGGTEYWKARTGIAKHTKERAIPYICYINVEKCKERGIKYFDDKRIYGLTQNGDNYDTGASFLEDIKENELVWKKITPLNFIVHYKAGSWVEDAKIHDNYKQLNFDTWLEVNKKYWNKIKNDKVVYTCITGGYDSLIEPTRITPGFDYVCFTDNKSLSSTTWDIRPLPKETEELSQVKKQRYVKLNPHKLFGEYELSIWVDGNVDLKGDLNRFIDENIVDDISIYVPTHPSRNCIYAESNAVVKMKKDTSEIVNPQIDKYKAEGFPANYGLLQSNILIRKHNEPDCIRLMEAWSEEVMNGSHRDQLSFNYCCWKNEDIKVEYLDKKIYNSEWFFWKTRHNSNKKVTPQLQVESKRIDESRKKFREIIEKARLNRAKRIKTNDVMIY